MQLDKSDSQAAHWGNAAFLAAASDFAYEDAAKAGALFQAELGLTVKLFSVGNTQGYLGSNDDHLVVAFRGTESPTSIEGLKDVFLSDANNLMIIPEGRLGTDFAAAGVGARYHRGFLSALGEIWEPLYAAVDAELKAKERPLWITGHSLGGALAHLAAWRFLQNFVSPHRIYTYGAPMVGYQTAILAFDKELKGRVFRLVHDPDPVPLLPTISLLTNSYVHCQKELLLRDPAGNVPAAAAFFKELGASLVKDIFDGNLMDRVWQYVISRVEAHGIAKYREQIEREKVSK